MSALPSLSELEIWLDTFLNFERLPQKNIFWLDTMEFLCRTFGDPQKCGKAVHVAGSKGKGSVSAMISCILQEAGNHCGLYTSPHILDFAERVGNGTAPFSDDVYRAAFDELKSGVERIAPEDLPAERPITWFELVTLFAFLVFRREKTGYAVYETGLGGRLDATNVLAPEISVITAIELEHTEYLGDTIEAIAREKGGIIKTGTPVLIGVQNSAVAHIVRQVFTDIAREKNAPIFFAEDMPARPINVKLALYGHIQTQNAALAAAAVKMLLPKIDDAHIEAGLQKAYLPARFEIIKHPAKFSGIPLLVIDGAHTVNSIAASIAAFENIRKETTPATSVVNADVPSMLIFACAADKDVEHIAPLFSRFACITLTRPGDTKQSDTDRLKKAFDAAALPYRHDDNYARAITDTLTQASAQQTAVLVIGSFYLAAEVKRILA